MWIDYLLIESIFVRIILELLRNSACCNPLAITVQKQITGRTIGFIQPFHCFRTELFRNVQSPQLAAFGIQIKIANLNVFDFNLNQFADTCTCCRQIPDNKIPFGIAIFFKLPFQKCVIRIADHIFQKVFLLNFHGLQAKCGQVEVFQILIQCLNSQIYRFWFVVFHQITFVGKQIF